MADLFAPPSKEELDLFAPPSPEELGQEAATTKKQEGDWLSSFSEGLETVRKPLGALTQEAARSATFGLSEKIPEWLGVSTPEEAEQIRKESPVASTIGSVTGAVASPALAAGAVSKAAQMSPRLAKLKATVEALADKGIVPKALLTSLKGAFGAGADTATQAAIEAKPGERLQAAKEAGGTAALVGGALGGVGGAIGKAASSLAETAPQQTLAKVGITPAKQHALTSRYGKDIADATTDLIKQKKLLPGMDASAALNKTKQLLTSTGNKISGTLEDLHREQVPVDIKGALTDVEQILVSKFPDPENIADKTIKDSYNKITTEILPEMRNAATSGGWQDLSNMRKYLVDRLATKTTNLPISKSEYRDAIVALDDVISHNLSKVNPDLGNEFRKIKTEYGALKSIEEGLSKKRTETPWKKIKEGKILEGAGKAVAAPGMEAIENKLLYAAPRNPQDLEKLITGTATTITKTTRPATIQQKDKKKNK